MSKFSVETDRDDYAPRSTAYFTTSGLSAGSSVQFQVVNHGADGIYGTRDDIVYKSWVVTDGGLGDGSSDTGWITTDWWVSPSAQPRADADRDRGHQRRRHLWQRGRPQRHDELHRRRRQHQQGLPALGRCWRGRLEQQYPE